MPDNRTAGRNRNGGRQLLDFLAGIGLLGNFRQNQPFIINERFCFFETLKNERWVCENVHSHRLSLFSLNALKTTDTELRLMAAAAIIGLSKIPKTGYRTPAATGTPRAL